MNKDDFFCKIFVDTDEQRDYVINALCNYLGATINRYTICNTWCEISLMRNEDFHEEHRYSKGKDSFLYFRYYLEVFPVDKVPQDIYIKQVGDMLLYLNSKGFRVVSACYFEERLPQQGIFM